MIRQKFFLSTTRVLSNNFHFQDTFSHSSTRMKEVPVLLSLAFLKMQQLNKVSTLEVAALMRCSAYVN